MIQTETKDLLRVKGADIVQVVVREIDTGNLKNSKTTERSTITQKSISSQTIENSTTLTIDFSSRCFHKSSLLSILS